MGFSHNNCGGFCVKAGLAHFRNLLEKMPDRYAYHEAKEQELRAYLGRNDIGFLRKSVNGKRRIVSMKEFREGLHVQMTFDEMLDFGGCGCFSEAN
jgi:hypothetical protein